MYSPEFFDSNLDGEVVSAQIVLPSLLARLGARSVVDVGCGCGGWLSVAKEHGCRVLGIDGHVPDDHLVISPDEFRRQDLTAGVDCYGYDLAMCMEVAEHLPASTAELLVEGLCKAPWVLFSPAIPGQGGIGHINERWGSWWAGLFAMHGYDGSSDLRWAHWEDRRIQNWYRQNMLVFSTRPRLIGAGFRPGVIDVVHPERLRIW